MDHERLHVAGDAVPDGAGVTPSAAVNAIEWGATFVAIALNDPWDAYAARWP